MPMHVIGICLCSEQRLGPAAESTLKCVELSVFSSIRSVHFSSFFCLIWVCIARITGDFCTFLGLGSEIWLKTVGKMLKIWIRLD